MKKKNYSKGKKKLHPDDDAPKSKFEKNKKRKRSKSYLKDVAKGNMDYYDYIDEVEESQ
tara:strand:+ start:667 stop:843 length:177 start_codon:yes stop_codon:yes gene_type:complete